MDGKCFNRIASFLLREWNAILTNGVLLEQIGDSSAPIRDI